MQDFISGTDVKIAIPLMEGRFPLVPTIGTTFFTLLDHAGLAMPGFVQIPVTTDVATTTVSVTVPAAQNHISVAKSFERRTLVLAFDSNGATKYIRQQYRIIPQLNHCVTPASVRDFLGMNLGELGDDVIDLPAAYFRFVEAVPNLDLPAKLSAGTMDEIRANEAIRMLAVLDVLPSLKQRLAQQESNGVVSFRRANIDKLNDIERRAMDRYAAARDTLMQATEVTMTHITVTQDTDTITGE